MLKFGLITQIDAAKGLAKVQFKDNEDLESYWLAILGPKTQNDKDYHIPDIGEQVACLMDQHFEEGVILGALYSDVDTPPVDSADKRHLEFSDGTWLQYDRSAHRLSGHIEGDLRLALTGNLNLIVEGNANVKIEGEADIHAAGAAKIISDGVMDVESKDTLNLRAPKIVTWVNSSSSKSYEPVEDPAAPDAPEK